MNTNRHEWFFDRINGMNGIIATEVEPPVSDCIRPVLQAKALLEIYFCAGLDLYYSVSDETGGMYCIRPVLQAKALLEIYFCAGLDLYYSVSDETGGMFE
jgi:hypothetical protein